MHASFLLLFFFVVFTVHKCSRCSRIIFSTVCGRKAATVSLQYKAALTSIAQKGHKDTMRRTEITIHSSVMIDKRPLISYN